MRHRISGRIVFIIIWFGAFGGVASGQSTTDTGTLETLEEETETTVQDSLVDPDEAINKAIQALESIGNDQDQASNRRAFEEATTYIQQAQRADPAHALLPFARGWAFVQAGRNRLARTELQKFVETRSGRNEWRALLLLGDLFVDEYPQLAKAQYEKALALKPDEPSITFGLARAAFLLGNLSDAVELARTAIRQNGSGDVSHVDFLADALMAEGQWDEAVQEAKNAITLALRDTNRNPGRRAPLVVLESQYKRLIQIIQEKIATMEGVTADYMKIAETIRLRARLAEKLALHDIHAVLGQAVHLAGDAVAIELLQQYGAASADIGRPDEAIDIFERVLARDPENAVAKTRMQELRPADIPPKQ